MPPTITFQMRPGDARVLTPATMKPSTAALMAAAAGAAIGGGGLTFLAFAIGWRDDSRIWLAGALAGAVAMIWFAARRYERAITPPVVPPEPMTMRLTEQGLDLQHPEFSSRHAWRAITGIEEQADHIIVKTRQSGAFVIPRRDFPDAAAADAFAAALRAGQQSL